VAVGAGAGAGGCGIGGIDVAGESVAQWVARVW